MPGVKTDPCVHAGYGPCQSPSPHPSRSPHPHPSGSIPGSTPAPDISVTAPGWLPQTGTTLPPLDVLWAGTAFLVLGVLLAVAFRRRREARPDAAASEIGSLPPDQETS